MQKHIILGTSLTLLAALITGCEINEDVNPNLNYVPQTTQVTITPSLGKILNAKVVLKNAKTGDQIGEEGNTGTSGTATFNVPKTADPVIIEVQGVDGAQGATYYDEASDSNVALPSTQKIRAIAPNLANNANIGVTVLTELAVQAAEKTLGGSLSTLTAQVANDANNQIKALLAKELGANSLLTPPTIVGKDTIVKDVITAQNAANDYALKLAGLAKLGSGDSPVLDVLQKLSDDISDNKLDGMKGTTEIDYSTGETADITDALQAYIAAYANAAQINTIYTSTVLNNFSVTEGNITITIGGTGGGTGSGQNCALHANYNISGISASYTVCYINFPQNAVCGAGNSAFSSTSIPGYAGSINWTYSQVATCPAGSIQINYVN